MEEVKMFTRKETANILGTTLYTIDMLRDLNILNPIKIGKQYMYSKPEIARFEEDYTGMSLGNKEEAIYSRNLVLQRQEVFEEEEGEFE